MIVSYRWWNLGHGAKALGIKTPTRRLQAMGRYRYMKWSDSFERKNEIPDKEIK